MAAKKKLQGKVAKQKKQAEAHMVDGHMMKDSAMGMKPKPKAGKSRRK
mgnify:CR=1 FL=1